MNEFEIDCRGQTLTDVRMKIDAVLRARHSAAIDEATSKTAICKGTSAQSRLTIVVKGPTAEQISILQSNLEQVVPGMLFPVKISFKEIQPSSDFDIHM